MAPDEEVPLTGGNMNTVVRVGDTVRRTAGPWTPTIHALLRHIRANGFTLGARATRDRRARPRDPDLRPRRHGVLSAAGLGVLRRDARCRRGDGPRLPRRGGGFVAPPGAVWQLPVHEPVEVVCHNDIAPYNLVFDGERLTGVIDWDLASPGPRVWDLAYAAYRFVPLASPDNPDIPYPGVDEQARRLARLCAAYGAADVTPRVVLDTAAIRLRDLNAFMHREAAAGNAAQQAIIDRGRGRIYDARRRLPRGAADEHRGRSSMMRRWISGSRAGSCSSPAPRRASAARRRGSSRGWARASSSPTSTRTRARPRRGPARCRRRGALRGGRHRRRGHRGRDRRRGGRRLRAARPARRTAPGSAAGTRPRTSTRSRRGTGSSP